MSNWDSAKLEGTSYPKDAAFPQLQPIVTLEDYGPNTVRSFDSFHENPEIQT